MAALEGMQMKHMRQAARDISYAHSAETWGGRAVIRALENATGRIGLIRRAERYQRDVASGADFWSVMVGRYGLSLNLVGGSLSDIPSEGPLVLVANHPYGILDGLVLGHILSHRRDGDFRILAHRVFRKAEELDKVILPISFDETKEGIATNLATRREAIDYLKKGGAIGIFPGGTVSTSRKPFSRPLDPGWRSFTAKMIVKSNATVVPIYFSGQNSRLFQIASHLHNTLRLGLLIGEFGRRVDTSVEAVIGAPIQSSELVSYHKDPNAMMDFLRARTYALSPSPLDVHEHGFEFEAKHRRGENGGRHI